MSALHFRLPIGRLDLHDQEPIGLFLIQGTPICRRYQERKGHVMKTNERRRAESLAADASAIVMWG